MARGPSTSSPPFFLSFSDWWKSATPKQPSVCPPEPILVLWKLPVNSLTVGLDAAKSHSAERQEEVNIDLTLGGSLPSWGINTVHRHTEDTTLHHTNPAQEQVQKLTTQSHPAENSEAAMVFQRADPRPFLSPKMIWEDIPNRSLMVRAVASHRPQPMNENVVIATINPLW